MLEQQSVEARVGRNERIGLRVSIEFGFMRLQG